MSTNPDPYCAICHREARIVLVKDTIDERPITEYLSECCNAHLVTWNRKPIPLGTLINIYVLQESWEVDDYE